MDTLSPSQVVASDAQPIVQSRQLRLPRAPVCVLQAAKVQWLSAEGEFETLSSRAFVERAKKEMPIVCHAPYMASKLGIDPFLSYDVLELFAFTHPGRFTLPTARGLAKTLGLFIPEGAEQDPSILLNIARHLLQDLVDCNLNGEKSDPIAAAWIMAMGRQGFDAGLGWPWAPAVLTALGAAKGMDRDSAARAGVQIWHRMEDWSDIPHEGQAKHDSVSGDEAEARLKVLLSHRDQSPRPAQTAYARDVAKAFAPVDVDGAPHAVLAEAGTGIGKTLGYLAPATLWAEKNDTSVWISTYTRNLQRQIDQELDRLYPDLKYKQRKVVVRKGRENYLCLLNLEDAIQSPTLQHNVQNAIGIGLMTRWAAVTRDGDLTGQDFPGWLVSLLGWGRTYGLSDRRGECIYGACSHYSKCFIEKSKRQAKRADIVVANHALVMINAALSNETDILPSRYIFDEGHHVFDAADSAFSSHLSGVETADFRRWVLGSENEKRSRAKGLVKRAQDLIVDDEIAEACVQDIVEIARRLPGQGWRNRLKDGNPRGVTETFLSLVRGQTYARSNEKNLNYSIETVCRPLVAGVFESAYALSMTLTDLKRPMDRLIERLKARLEDSEEFELMSADDRARLESLAQSLKRRSTGILAGWISMLNHLNTETPEDVVDWFGVQRIDGRDFDVGMFRHWVDPTRPFAASLSPHTHGAIMTSASLRDNTHDDENDWRVAEDRTGLTHLTMPEVPAHRTRMASPFDYKTRTRVIVVKDVPKNEYKQVAAAYRALNFASQGGALNLFTSIQRQRAVYDVIAGDLEDAGFPVYAQHLDGLHVSTLIDMFRDDEDSILFGTDATRDGMDVPGRALRTIVFDRVPWPRPDILHKARRAHFGKTYDDFLVRARLKQAFGRLIRGVEDRGIFVILDPMLPTRLCSAFPEGVEIERMGLSEAVAAIKDYKL